MVIAELFANLSIKGADQTVGALKDVGKSLDEVKSTSLETKAAILAAVYAFEQMVQSAGQRGTDLVNFNAVLGVSTKTLQEYQYAARQAGASNEDVAGSFKSVQEILTKASLGMGSPIGLARLQTKTGVDLNDLKKYAERPEEFYKLLQSYVQKENSIGQRNLVLRSFGLNDAMIAAMARGAFTNQNLKTAQNAPSLDTNESDRLAKAQVAIANMKASIDLMIQKFMAAHGMELAKDLVLITTNVLQLAAAFSVLATKLDVFGKLAAGAKDLATVIKGLTGFLSIGDKIEDIKKDKTGKKQEALKNEVLSGFGPKTQSVLKYTGIADFVSNKVLGTPANAGKETASPNMWGVLSHFFGTGGDIDKEEAAAPTSGIFDSMTEKMFGKDVDAKDLVPEEKTPDLKLAVPPSPLLPEISNPEPNAPLSKNSDPIQNINITQNVTFQGIGPTDDAKKAAHALKREINNAVRQNYAMVAGS